MATSGQLDTLAEHQRAWYRLVGITSADDSLVEQGEVVGDVVLLALTRGYRACQRWLIDNGLRERWRKRSTAITWSGSDAADGGRYVDLDDICTDGTSPPNEDFLRLDGNYTDRSALVTADGTQWGQEVSPDFDSVRGSFYYLKNDQIWLTKSAAPPSPVYARYYYTLQPISAGTTLFDMPMDARWLAVAEAADAAVKEQWVPGGDAVEARVGRALQRAREEARRLIPRTREPRKMRHVTVYGSHW